MRSKDVRPVLPELHIDRQHISDRLLLDLLPDHVGRFADDVIVPDEDANTLDSRSVDELRHVRMGRRQWFLDQDRLRALVQRLGRQRHVTVRRCTNNDQIRS